MGSIIDDLFSQFDETEVLKKSLRKKIVKFKSIADQYSCGTNLMLNMNSEAHILKKEIDTIWAKLQKLDSECPEGSWL